MVEIIKEDFYIIVKKGNVSDKVLIDDNNEQYLALKKQTNNFTQNMYIPSENEVLSNYILDLDFKLVMLEMGVL